MWDSRARDRALEEGEGLTSHELELAVICSVERFSILSFHFFCLKENSSSYMLYVDLSHVSILQLTLQSKC